MLPVDVVAQGVIQPVVVREIARDKGGKVYEIIAGERRWRASQIAGLAEVPCLVRDIPDEAALAMALIENIQRENLNAMEEAVALTRLQSEFGLSQQQVADGLVGHLALTVGPLGPLAQGMVFAQVVPSPWERKHAISREYQEAMAKGRPGMALSYGSLEGFLTAKALVLITDSGAPVMLGQASYSRAAEREVGAAGDLQALWQAELELLGQATISTSRSPLGSKFLRRTSNWVGEIFFTPLMQKLTRFSGLPLSTTRRKSLIGPRQLRPEERT